VNIGDDQLAKQWNLEIGAVIELGNSSFTVKDIILKETDRGAAFMNFSPVMIREQDLAQTQLLGFGSRATYRLLIASGAQLDYRKGQDRISSYENWALDYDQKRV
jgi:putative ABC transport system permease protein